MSILKIFFTSFMVIVLTGCEQNLTYSYLMQHPSILKKEMERCQTSENQNSSCEIVRTAANDFVSLLKEQQENPEKFGERIMSAQIAYKKAEEDFAVNKNNENARAELQKKHDEVKTLQAVVGLSSPE